MLKQVKKYKFCSKNTTKFIFLASKYKIIRYMEATRTMVIDDDLKFCAAYEYFFEQYENYDLVGVYTGVFDALDAFEKIKPDIIISDISMPMMNGIEGMKLFRRKDDQVKFILISSHSDMNLIKDAFSNMANGYLTKPVSEESLLEALNAVRDKGVKISMDITQKVISSFHRKKYDMFSDRENEIVELLAVGETYRSIADKLFVTPSTINFHVQNIYLKLNVNSKAEALAKLKNMDCA